MRYDTLAWGGVRILGCWDPKSLEKFFIFRFECDSLDLFFESIVLDEFAFVSFGVRLVLGVPLKIKI